MTSLFPYSFLFPYNYFLPSGADNVSFSLLFPLPIQLFLTALGRQRLFFSTLSSSHTTIFNRPGQMTSLFPYSFLFPYNYFLPSGADDVSFSLLFPLPIQPLLATMGRQHSICPNFSSSHMAHLTTMDRKPQSTLVISAKFPSFLPLCLFLTPNTLYQTHFLLQGKDKNAKK